MAAIATNTLLDEVKCYACPGASLTQLLKLGLLRRALLARVPTADTSMQALITYGNCYFCYGASFADVLELSLLDQLSQAP